jgi:hypothetical protein
MEKQTIAFKQVAAFDNFMIANMTLGMLEENDINCHLIDEHIVTIDPLLNTAVGGIKLMVAEVQFLRAQEIIKDAETAYLNEVTCPVCKGAGLQAEEKINKPTSFWGKLKNQVAYGQTEISKKLYRCKNCGSVFTEIPVTY